MTALFGFDVSHYQGNVNMATAKAAGYTFAVAKATEGTTYTDVNFSQNMRGAIAAGLLPGAYHFLDPGNGAAQASRFYSVVKSSIGGVEGKLCVLDVESGTASDVWNFVTQWKAITKHPLVIYSGAWFWVGHLNNPNASTLGCPLWDSHYVPTTGYGSTIFATVPSSFWIPQYGGWGSLAMLQFTSSATVNGVSGHADADVSLGSVGMLTQLANSNAVAPAPAPAPTPSPYGFDAASISLGGSDVAYVQSVGLPNSSLLVLATSKLGVLYRRRWMSGKWVDVNYCPISTEPISGAFSASLRPGTSTIDLLFVGSAGDIRQMYSFDYGFTWRL